MLFSLVIAAGCSPAEGGVAGFWPTKTRAVPSAPGVLRTRHPRLGAAERRAALLVNVLTRRELANCACYRVSFRRSALTSLFCPLRFERMVFFKVRSQEVLVMPVDQLRNRTV